eukprot:3178934-Pleurochrysis_carterae.AAC.1
MQFTFLAALHLVRTSFVLETWIPLPSPPREPSTPLAGPRTVRAGSLSLLPKMIRNIWEL